MPEVGVAFPNDEATAEVLVSRLRAGGIGARVDRGMWGTRVSPLPRGQITVFVDARDARKAHRILGSRPRAEEPSQPLLTLGVIVAAIGIALGFFVLVLAAALGR